VNKKSTFANKPLSDKKSKKTPPIATDVYITEYEKLNEETIPMSNTEAGPIIRGSL
jgi:hypothetical protein